MSDYDKTLVELDEATDIPDSAIGYAILDPSGTPVDRKFTWQNARKTPSRVVFVDGRYTANVTPYFDNISDALTATNAMTPTVGNPVTIKAFSDTDGSPIGLGDNDYYTLRDSGIVFDSSYDPIKRLFTGGDLKASELLYDFKIEHSLIDLRF
jgi:hypothetical protein